ncbi:MAG: hypothetical protein WBQ86_09535 [Candidatus Binatus sp.]
MMHHLLHFVIHSRQSWGFGLIGYIVGCLYTAWHFRVGIFDSNWRWRD